MEKEKPVLWSQVGEAYSENETNPSWFLSWISISLWLRCKNSLWACWRFHWVNSWRETNQSVGSTSISGKRRTILLLTLNSSSAVESVELERRRRWMWWLLKLCDRERRKSISNVTIAKTNVDIAQDLRRMRTRIWSEFFCFCFPSRENQSISSILGTVNTFL